MKFARFSPNVVVHMSKLKGLNEGVDDEDIEKTKSVKMI